MKRILSLLFLMNGLPLWADQEISLQPGSSVDLNGFHVRCMGSLNDQPRCSVSSAGSNYYYVMVGNKTWGTVDGFEKAIKTTIELKQAGLCS